MTDKKQFDATICTVNQFIQGWFEGVEIENFEDIYSDYIDISGLAETQEYSLLTTIHNLQARLIAIPHYVAVQDETVKIFGKYHPIATERLSRYGYKMPLDVKLAPKMLSNVLSKEKRFRYDLQAAEDKLKALKKPESETQDLKKQRRAFIKMLNSLGTKYRIDRDKTTVEELALMVKESMEQAAQEAMDRQMKSAQRR